MKNKLKQTHYCFFVFLFILIFFVILVKRERKLAVRKDILCMISWHYTLEWQFQKFVVLMCCHIFVCDGDKILVSKIKFLKAPVLQDPTFLRSSSWFFRLLLLWCFTFESYSFQRVSGTKLAFRLRAKKMCVHLNVHGV